MDKGLTGESKAKKIVFRARDGASSPGRPSSTATSMRNVPLTSSHHCIEYTSFDATQSVISRKQQARVGGKPGGKYEIKCNNIKVKGKSIYDKRSLLLQSSPPCFGVESELPRLRKGETFVDVFVKGAPHVLWRPPSSAVALFWPVLQHPGDWPLKRLRSNSLAKKLQSLETHDG